MHTLIGKHPRGDLLDEGIVTTPFLRYVESRVWGVYETKLVHEKKEKKKRVEKLSNFEFVA